MKNCNKKLNIREQVSLKKEINDSVQSTTNDNLLRDPFSFLILKGSANEISFLRDGSLHNLSAVPRPAP